MRKVAFISGHSSIKKVMLYECVDGVYVFGYDCLQDTGCISDYLQDTLEAAEEFCKNKYEVDSHDWIMIADPLDDCQDDFIMPTRVKGKEQGNPEWGKFQTLVNGHWLDLETSGKTQSFDGLTVNERLVVTGLMTEFDLALQNDSAKADKILLQLRSS